MMEWASFKGQPVAHLVERDGLYYHSACGKKLKPRLKVEDCPIVLKCYKCGFGESRRKGTYV